MERSSGYLFWGIARGGEFIHKDSSKAFIIYLP